MISMNDTAKKLIRSGYTPLELKDFTEATQKEFCELINKENNSGINKLLKYQAYRGALYDLLDTKRQNKDHYEEELKLIRKDLEIIDCCYDPPITRFYDDSNSQVIEFFEDYTVLLTYVDNHHHPRIYDNYYTYIYNNIKYLYHVMYYEEKIKENKLEKFGVYFEEDGDKLNVLYTEKFKEGVFTPSHFKPKIE